MPRMRSPRSSLPSPLDGRKFWIAGIGGAGMSAYALLARAWGAEVRGWDRTPTAYLEQLAGIDVEISDDPPPPPEGWEAFVSTAFVERVRGKRIRSHDRRAASAHRGGDERRPRPSRDLWLARGGRRALRELARERP